MEKFFSCPLLNAVFWTLVPSLASAQCDPVEFAGSNSSSGARFGTSIALRNEYAFVGADRDDEAGANAGAAYVIRRVGLDWVEEAKLFSANPDSNYHFGHAVAALGDFLFVGEPDDDDLLDKAGSVHVFERIAGVWTHQDELTASDFDDGDRFGWSIAADDFWLVIGAKHDDEGGNDAGAAYVFTQVGNTWTESQKLVAGDASDIAQFGDAVAIEGSLLLVGAWQDGENGTFSGAAYLFRWLGSFQEEAKARADRCHLLPVLRALARSRRWLPQHRRPW